MAWICILIEVGERLLPVLHLLPLLLLSCTSARQAACNCDTMSCSTTIRHAACHACLTAGADRFLHDRPIASCMIGRCCGRCLCDQLSSGFSATTGFSALMICAKYYLDNWGPNS